MGDTNRDWLEEIQEERTAQEIAQPTQPVDSTTLAVAKIVALRLLTAVNADVNTVIDSQLPD